MDRNVGYREIKLKQMWDRAGENRANFPFPTCCFLGLAHLLGQHPSSKSTFSLISTTQPLSCCGCAPMLLWQSGCFRLFFVFSPVWLSPLPSPSPALFPLFLSVGMGVVSAAADWHICLSSAHQPLAKPWSFHYSGARFVPSCMLTIQCRWL